MFHRFREFPASDPELPREVDPLRELRNEAVATFDDVHEGLAQAADDHFHGLAQRD